MSKIINKVKVENAFFIKIVLEYITFLSFMGFVVFSCSKKKLEESGLK